MATNPKEEFIDKVLRPKIFPLKCVGVGMSMTYAFQFMRTNLFNSKKKPYQINVGIELGGTNYKAAFGTPEFDQKQNLINYKLDKQVSGRVTDNRD
jgi:hypothetical protein